MRAGVVRFGIEGLSLERLLNQCAGMGVRLEDIKRPKARLIVASVDNKEFWRIRALAKQQGWKVTVQRVSGWPWLRMFAWRRAALVAGVIVFVAVAWYLCNCVWTIQVHGAGPYLGEVRQVLRENDIQPGRFGFGIDVEALRTVLERRLTGLSWVSVSIDGVRLKVYCVQGVRGAPSQAGRNTLDVVAVRDGIVDSIHVAAGTAQVKQGEAVRKGQVLIKGEERGWQGAVVNVQAQGEVLARVWYTADVIIPKTEVATVLTGQVATRKIYGTPWLEWTADAAPTFEQADAAARQIAIGAILPLWLRIETYEEVVFEERERGEAALQAEGALAALRMAQEEAGLDKPIVDKWVDYSMIEKGLQAHLTLEVVENIAK